MTPSIRSCLWVLSLALFAAATLAGAAVAETVLLNPAKDNTILSDLTGNSNGAGDGFFAGKIQTGGIRRGLVAFDLSSIPAGATINSVSLTIRMAQTVSGAQTVLLSRVTSNWGEGTSSGSGTGAPATVGDATWLSRFFNTLAWASPGGDFAAVPSATQSVGAVGSYTWTGPGLAADVAFWKASPASNFGWIVIGNEGANGTAKRFDSRESLTPPTLTVNFTPRVPGATGWALALLGLVMAGAAAGMLRQRSEA